MNQDFNHKPVTPVQPPQPSFAAPPQSPPSASAPQPIETTPVVQKVKKAPKRKKLLLLSILGVFVLLLAVAAAGYSWYQSQLSSVDSNNNEFIKVTVEPNSTPSMISQLLKDKGVIRSTEAFGIYTRLSGTQNSLQAGAYRLSPSETTPEIVEHLTSGKVDTFDLTFLPGATLADNRKVLIEAGFTEAEVDAGLNATYDSPLFEGKPASADLEGYIYGETYKFGSDATVKEVLSHTFDVYAEFIQENNIIAKLKAQNLTLFEGITLASIVQRESIGGDEPQIASVFYNRLAIDMPLGSDVTYQYIADKTGVERDTNLDSPYNTRRYPGLPPGPIAAPGKNALLAVATPATTDYVYFLSGDDDVTYYGVTLEEHEANIAAHCKVKCLIL